MVEINASKETLQFFFRSRDFHSGDGIHFLGERRDPIRRHGVPKESDCGDSKYAFVLVDPEARLGQPLEDSPDVRDVEFWRDTCNQDVVQIYEDER